MEKREKEKEKDPIAVEIEEWKKQASERIKELAKEAKEEVKRLRKETEEKGKKDREEFQQRREDLQGKESKSEREIHLLRQLFEDLRRQTDSLRLLSSLPSNSLLRLEQIPLPLPPPPKLKEGQ